MRAMSKLLIVRDKGTPPTEPIIITSVGDWICPYTGQYRITLIGRGGNGGDGGDCLYTGGTYAGGTGGAGGGGGLAQSIAVLNKNLAITIGVSETAATIMSSRIGVMLAYHGTDGGRGEDLVSSNTGARGTYGIGGNAAGGNVRNSKGNDGEYSGAGYSLQHPNYSKPPAKNAPTALLTRPFNPTEGENAKTVGSDGTPMFGGGAGGGAGATTIGEIKYGASGGTGAPWGCIIEYIGDVTT